MLTQWHWPRVVDGCVARRGAQKVAPELCRREKKTSVKLQSNDPCFRLASKYPFRQRASTSVPSITAISPLHIKVWPLVRGTFTRLEQCDNVVHLLPGDHFGASLITESSSIVTLDLATVTKGGLASNCNCVGEVVDAMSMSNVDVVPTEEHRARNVKGMLVKQRRKGSWSGQFRNHPELARCQCTTFGDSKGVMGVVGPIAFQCAHTRLHPPLPLSPSPVRLLTRTITKKQRSAQSDSFASHWDSTALDQNQA